MGEVNVLYAFQTMHDNLPSKRAQVSHNEVLAELLVNSFSNELEDEADGGEGGYAQNKET